ncbi:hypothetical protein ACIPYU_05610 [Paenarthrobacter nicotinovorans]|uniref:hypothetical protein n=1 Tax=Paenarthrobacter nicotinovorans TaxID=29320 RepID=UPI003804A221
MRERTSRGRETMLAARRIITTSEKGSEKRLAEAQAQTERERGVRTLGLPIDIDPGNALLDEIHWTAGHVQLLREKVQELQDEELVWGRTQTDAGFGPHGPVDTAKENAGPSVWYELYMKERDHLAKGCALRPEGRD